MTEEVAARRGRPMLIAARLPDSVAYNKAIGLDQEAAESEWRIYVKSLAGG